MGPVQKMLKGMRRCVRFWYYLSGTEDEQLSVLQRDEAEQETLLWNRTAEQVVQRSWLPGMVEVVGFDTSVQPVFAGLTSTHFQAVIAVDDVYIDLNDCPAPGSCDFHYDFCDWRNIEGIGNMRWYLSYGETVSKETGPSKDHTYDTPTGGYLLLDSQDLAEYQRGILESDLLSTGPSACLRFFYHIAVGADSNLKVEFLDLTGTPLTSGEISKINSSDWTKFEIEANGLPSQFLVRLTGYPGSWSRSDIAIDDIAVLPGSCTPSTKPTQAPTAATSSAEASSSSTVGTTKHQERSTTQSGPTENTAPKSPTTSAIPTSSPGALECVENQFNCRDDEHCIPLALVCDGVDDCPNGLDEKCGSQNKCKPEEFFCLIPSPYECIPRSFLCDDHDDCGDGSDESLCGTCPANYCRNGGVCNVTDDDEPPKCDCPTEFTGRRCEVSTAPRHQEYHIETKGSSAASVAVPVVLVLLILCGAPLGYLYYRRRRALLAAAPVYLNNPTYDAATGETNLGT